ncbi:LysR substrate-binding domain-containing protein [Pseudomonas sp. NPDC008258]|uniref:LysR substrate-binding domain-containing protein n=1 Tax=Pseudomonas sp. NPDC008258 TaxID=3364418 RepID=UPI0036F03FA6
MLLQKLALYELDAAFVAEPFEPGRCSSAPAFDDVLTLITAKGEAAITRAADLRGMTMVVFPHGCSYRRRLVEWLAAEAVSPGKLLEIGSYHAIVACVAAGMGGRCHLPGVARSRSAGCQRSVPSVAGCIGEQSNASGVAG